uniref:Uncharacterized protein n=1 Tax=Amphimedon queenslandica TaxID=400682 RepID=A0A1X7SY46_AMPQE
MLKRVDPLRKELKDLETKAEDTRQKGEEITKIIAELEASIAKYKEEYAMVISDASVIKNDLSTVEKKFLLRLRHLEKSLLTALNEVKGRILDNNREKIQIKKTNKMPIENSNSRPSDVPPPTSAVKLSGTI